MSVSGKTIVLFDADCGLCRDLAELARRRAGTEIRFEAWQEYRETDEARAALAGELLAEPADKLRVWTGTVLLEADTAWTWLLDRHPDLSALNWLAKRMGITSVTGSALNRAGHILRRFCSRCGLRGVTRPS